jgi:hypothetical protein
MANQLTYDPTEYSEEQFTADELDSLQVGEELAEEQEKLLAGKYRDAEELEAAYIELQKKLGSREEEAEPEVDTNEEEQEEYELPAGAGLIQEASAEYYANNGQLSDETLEKFSGLSSRDLVEAYLALQANQPQEVATQAVDISERDVNSIQNSVGGEQAYANLVQWAAENLPADYVTAFDSVVESGKVQAIQLAVAGLQREYENAVGYEGRVLSGKAPVGNADVFRSQAEVVRAMNDPRYEDDPAYRQDIFNKLERSNIQY